MWRASTAARFQAAGSRRSSALRTSTARSPTPGATSPRCRTQEGPPTQPITGSVENRRRRHVLGCQTEKSAPQSRADGLLHARRRRMMPTPVESSPLRVVTRPLGLVFAASFGFSTSFYLMLSVVPLYAASGGAGGAGAGLATGAFMLSTVSAELLTPDLMSHVGYRAAFAVGLVLLGAPAFALGAVPTAAGILAVCLARGFGLGIVPVVGGALVAELVPPEWRGEGLGLYGVAVGVPFAAGGLAALVGLAAIPGLPGR